MYFPFVSRSRFDDMLREKNTQIGDRDRQIAELEADRRMLWDQICFLAIAQTTFRHYSGVSPRFESGVSEPTGSRIGDQPNGCSDAKPTAQPVGQSEANDDAAGCGEDRQSSVKPNPTTAAPDPPKTETLESQPEPVSEPPDFDSTKAEKLDAQSGVKSEETDRHSPKAKALEAAPGPKSEATERHSPKAQALGSRRPSIIMRHMAWLAEKRFYKKLHPAKTAEQQREEAISQLNVAHIEAVRAGLNRLQ